jgi:DNA-binding FadR family transcriptional regulator
VSDPQLVKPRRPGASEQIAEELQRSIVARALVPGDRLGTEEELAREYGVSRPTLREAVRLLASVNLVRATKGPGGGVFVARTPEQGMGRTVSDAIARLLETQATSIPELLEVRTMLEVPLAGLAACRASGDTIERMRASIRDAEEHLDDEAVLRETDGRFHRAIAEAAGNQVAAAITEWAFDVLQPRLRDVIAPAVVEAIAVDQHRRILRAIESGEPAAAERAMREHLLYVADLVETVEAVAAGGGTI